MGNAYHYQGKKYYISVFVGTFLLWGIGGYMSFSPVWQDYYMLPMLAGLMMPAIVAVVLIWGQPEAAMKRDFIRRLVSPRLIRPGVFLLSLAVMPLSVVLAILLSLAFDGSTAQFRVADAFSFSTGFVPVLALLFMAAVFEELGWRGYGFDSLERGRGFVSASLLFGVLWSLWHLPLLWVDQSYQYEIYHQSSWYAVNFYVSTAILGVIVSWVCHINQRSILVAILFHFAVNLSQEMLSMTQETKIVQTFLLSGLALLILINPRSLLMRRE